MGEASSAGQGQQAMDAEGEAQVARDKRAPGDVRLPIPVRQRVAEAEATKRGQQPESESSQAEVIRFDLNTEIREPSPTQQRTALYSPTYAGEVSKSPADPSSTRHVRRVVEELELYNEIQRG